MTTNRKPTSILAAALLATLLAIPSASAQRGGPQGPQVVSPEVSAERKITFRVLAPKAEAVKIGGTDIPGINTNGVLA